MKVAIQELKVACPGCGQHCVVPAGESALQIDCPACGVGFVPADAVRFREDGSRFKPAPAKYHPAALPESEPPRPVTESRGDRLERKAVSVTWLAGVFLVVGFLGGAVAVGQDMEGIGSAAAWTFASGCVMLAFMIGVIGQLLHLRALLERPRR